MDNAPTRKIGSTAIEVTPVAMGCWPIAGMTSIDVNEVDSLKTLEAAFENGINFFDTAFCYGANGESEKLIAKALGSVRNEIVIATKCGIHWNDSIQRVIDGSPNRIQHEVELSLERLDTDHVELLYLHAPDPGLPIEDSAGKLLELKQKGLAKSIGLSNADLDQIKAFHQVCSIDAIQPPFNMLQQEETHRLLPWCMENNVSAMIYWPLMKGLLAGKLARDHQFAEKDGRAKYPMFQGEEWQKNQDFLDRIRSIAEELGKSVSQVVVNWTIQQTGVTAALCGAKRAEQIRENAGSFGWSLNAETLARIDQAIVDRGNVVTRAAV